MSLNESDEAPLPKQIIHDSSLHNQVLENVLSAKYLGITVTDDLDWVNTSTMLPIRQLSHRVSYAETWPIWGNSSPWRIRKRAKARCQICDR